MPQLNCHFVSRFLTRPWEHDDRRLTYFDFRDGGIHTQSSRTLFAAMEANTQQVEARLDAIIETPIAQAMTRLTDVGPGDRQEGLEWRIFRALALLMMLQPLRAPGVGGRNETLEATVQRTDEELDQIAEAARQSYHLGRITLRPDAALLYPAAGFFPIVAQDVHGNWRKCVAIPMALRHVAIAAPGEVDWDAAATLWAANGGGMLSNLSVGTSDRVVLPPAHVAAFQPREIARLVTEMRTDATRLLATARDVNEALARLNEV